jgi:hypothetical protein
MLLQLSLFQQKNVLLFCFLLTFILLLSFTKSYSADRYAVATGNWNATTTWAAESGGSPGASVPVAGDNVYVESVFTVTVTAAAACANLSIGDGSALSIGGFTFTVSGTTSIGGGVSGSLTITSTTAVKTFTGLVTINTGGTWSNSINSAVTFQGGITNNGTFTAGTGVQTFNTNSQTLSGVFSIPNVTVTGVTLTNNGTLTVGTALAGTGGLTQAGNATLNLGGTSAITSMNATSNINTVNYTGAAQTIKAVNYSTLNFSGSGIKTLNASITSVSGNFSLSGTATATLLANLSISGDLTVSQGTTLTLGVFTANTNSNDRTLTVAGTLNVGGDNNFPSGYSTYTMSGGTVNYNRSTGGQTIQLTPTYNNLTISNTSGIQTASGNISASTLTTAAGGTFDLTTFELAVSGTITNAGTIATQNISSTPLPSGKTIAGTVRYNALSGGQTIMSNTYTTLTLDNTSGTQTAAGNVTSTTLNTLADGTLDMVTNTLSVTGTPNHAGTLLTQSMAAAPITVGKTWGGTVNFNADGNQTVSQGIYNILELSSGGTKTFSASTVTVNDLLNIKSDVTLATGNFSLILRGDFINSGTFTAGSSAITITGTGTQNIAGFTTSGAVSMTKTDGTASFTGNVSGGLLTLNGNGGTLELGSYAYTFAGITRTNGTLNCSSSILNISGTTSGTGGTINPDTGTINYTSASAQSVFLNNYNNLGISGSGVKTLAGNISINGDLNISSGSTLTLGAFTANRNNDGGALTIAGTLNLGGSSGGIDEANNFPANFTSITFTGGTVVYNGTGAQTVSLFNYNNLTISGARTTNNVTLPLGTIGIAGIFTNSATFTAPGSFVRTDNVIDFNGIGAQNIPAFTFNHLTTSNGGTKTTTGAVIVSGNLTVGDQTTLTVGAFALTVNGTTTIGDVSSGTISFTSATGTKTFTGLVTINNSAIWNNSGNSPVIFQGGITNNGTFTAGSGIQTFNTNNQALNNSFTIPNVTVTGVTLTNNGTLTVSTALAGTGGLTQGLNSTLNLGGTSAITSLDATSNTNTVNYTGAAQTIKAVNYSTLNLSGSGAKTMNASITSVSGNFSLSGTATATLLANLTIGGDLSVGTGTSLTLNTFTANRDTNGGALTVAGTLLVGGTDNFPSGYSTYTMSGGTVNYNRSTGGQTIQSTPTYNNLTISNTSGIQTASGNISASTLTTSAGGTFDLTTFELAVSGTITNAGTIATQNLSSTPLPAGKTIAGTVRYNALSGGQTIMGNTYTTLNLGNTSGTQTASGNISASTLTTAAGGTFDLITFELAVSGTITNAGTIATQNISSTPLPTGKTITGTVIYNALSGGQTIMGNTYTTLNLENTSGTQTASGNITATSLNTLAGGTLDMVTYTLSVSGTPSHLGILLTQSTAGIPITAAKTWGGTVSFNASGNQTVSQGTYNNLELSNGGTKTLGASTVIVNGLLEINSGVTLSTGTNFGLTLGGNFTNNGTLNAGSSAITISGTSDQSLDGFTTLGTVTMTKTDGTATFYGNVNGGAFTLNGNGGTLDLGSGLTHTFTGAWTRTNGALLGNSSTLNIAGTVTNTAGTFTPQTSTVIYNGAAQTIANVNYHNLTLSNSGIKTLNALITSVSGNLNISGTASATLLANLTIGGDLSVGSGTSLTLSTFTANRDTNGGALTVAGALLVGGTDNFPSGYSTYNMSDGTVNYNRSSGGQTIQSTPTYNILTLSNTSGTQTSEGNINTATLNSSGGGTLEMGVFALTASTISHSGTIRTQNTSNSPIPSGITYGGSIVFNGSASQTLPQATFNNLTINNPSGASLNGSDISINGTLTLTSGIITTGLNAITANTISGGSASSYINGILKRSKTGTGSLIFPVGKGETYLPATINFTALTGTTLLTVQAFESGFNGTITSGVTQLGTRYWNISQSGATAFTFSLTLNAAGLTQQGATFIINSDEESATAFSTTFSSPNFTSSGISSMGDFILGSAYSLYVNGTTGNNNYDGLSPVFTTNNHGPKATISAGIAAAALDGCIVRVAAGTYAETFTISKNFQSFQLLGPNAGISASTASSRSLRNPEAIISGGIQIGSSGNSPNNLKIDGFKFIGSQVTFTDRVKIAAITGLNTIITNNIFDSELSASTAFLVSGSGTFGITLGGGYDHSGLQVTDNYFTRLRTGVFANPFNSAPLLFKDNQFSSRTGINFDHYGSFLTFADVQDNTFIDEVIGEDIVGPVTAINCTNLLSGSIINFTGNTINSNFVGIDFKNIANGATVNVSNNSFGKWESVSGVTYHIWVRLFNGTSGVTFSNNSFTDYGTGHAIFNSGGLVNAPCNWYGTTDFDILKNIFSGKILATPFLTDGTDNSLNSGFQPMENICTGIGPVVNQTQNTSFFKIQSAIDLANSGDVIQAGPGNYYEQISVNKSMNLKGAKTGIPAGPDPIPLNRGTEESIIYGSISDPSYGTDNLTIDGFTIKNSGGTIGIRGNNVSIINNILIGQKDTIQTSGTSSGVSTGTSIPTKNQQFTIKNNSINGFRFGLSLDGNGTQQNCKFNDNYISYCERAIQTQSSSFNGSQSEIKNNFLENNQRGLRLSQGGHTIMNNTILNNQLYGIYVTSFSPTYISDLTISNNIISGTTDGPGIHIDGTSQGFSNNFISNNSITYNGTPDIAIKNMLDPYNNIIDTIMATCNWYGAASNPASKISGNVTFNPWLVNGMDDQPSTIGFQPTVADQPGYVSAVAGNGQPIANGSTTISATNLTLMGSAPAGGYLVRNYSFTSATTCGAPNGATFTSLTFTGTAAERFSFGGVVISEEYDPGTYNFTISYQAHTEPATDDVVAVMTTIFGVYTFALRAVTVQPAATPSVAEILGNNAVIANGSFSPNTSNHTDFGAISTPGTLTRTFTVRNAGASAADPLTVGNISISGAQAGNFAVTTNSCENASLAAGASCTFTVSYTSGSVGVSDATVAVENSDAARDPYEFAIRAELLSPSISLKGNNTPITNGDDTPIAADHTFMGSLVAGQSITRSYTFKNLGLGGLQIGVGAVVLSEAPSPQNSGLSNFTVATQPAAGVYATNQEGFFSLTFTSPGQGSFYAMVTLTTQNAGTFTFVVQGEGPSPRMQVVGNNVEIISGDMIPSTADFTDFGTRSLDTYLDRTFAVRNPGSLGAAAPLILGGTPRAVVTGSTAFTVTIQPGSPIGVNGSTSFRIRYRPATNDCHEATISIMSNDPAPDRVTYTFVVRGGTTATPCTPIMKPFKDDFEWVKDHPLELSVVNDQFILVQRNDDSAFSEIRLYPNPASDMIFIDLPPGKEIQKISIIDTKGSVVHSFETYGGLEKLELSQIIPGIYMVVSSDQTVQPKRFVKTD